MWGATVLLGAWLLFQVQPMAGKRILPWFGGGPAVWTTAVLFFQTALLAGYLYAHAIVQYLRPRAQAILHSGLLLAAVALLIGCGAVADDAWKPSSPDYPRLRILAILAGTVGLPYLMLSATAPLVQSWWARTCGTSSPYRLYALSNLGSLVGLLSYPLAVEPLVGLELQGWIWTGLFIVFALLCLAGVWNASRWVSEAASEVSTAATRSVAKPAKRGRAAVEPVVTKRNRFLWLALPACASTLLLAVTNYLCQDVASLPLLWVAPLAVYLITFIVAFDADRWYVRTVWWGLGAISSFAASVIWWRHLYTTLAWQIGVHLVLLLAVGMVCHGEVARLRPPPRLLTSYYLLISLGGVLGSLFVVVVAPLLFVDFYELPIAVLVTWLLAIVVISGDERSRFSRRRWQWTAFAAAWGLLAFLSIKPLVSGQQHVVENSRNFFGVFRVREEIVKGQPIYRDIMSGHITHGSQSFAQGYRVFPTTYYSRWGDDPAQWSGLGHVLGGSPPGHTRRVGIVGLGTGTIASYARAGEVFRFYEINPYVIELAGKYFTYLKDARDRGAKIEIVDGDARLEMEHEPEQQFDVIVLDAFTNDAIPIHLMTREAFELYRRHLRPHGVIAVNISNRHLNLMPVMLAAAQQLKLDTRLVDSPQNLAQAIYAAVWVIMYPPEERERFGSVGSSLAEIGQPAVAWTDDYSAILGIWRWD
jgi:hypothetical protein